MKKKIIILVVLLLVGAGAWWALSGSGPEEITIVATQKVERGPVRQVLEATGIIKAQVGAQVKIGARATGVLVNVPVKVGERVAAGQLVAEIDARELEARIVEAQARYRLAQAKAERAGKELKRKQELVAKELETQSNLDQAVEDDRVTRAEAQAARASLDTLEVQLSYYKIYSPINGVVSQVAANEGETVVSGLQVSNLITVLAPEKLELWIYVDETDVGQSEIGQPVEYWVDAYPGKVFEGKVDEIYPEPEIRDNIVYYRALVRIDPEHAALLRPEMTTQCRIVVQELQDVLSIPNAALKWVEDRQVVFTRGPDGKAVEADVELGLSGLDRTQILSGLDEGDEVATQLVIPGGMLRPGGK